MQSITQHSKNERVSEVAIERQLDDIVTQSQCTHRLNKTRKDVTRH